MTRGQQDQMQKMLWNSEKYFSDVLTMRLPGLCDIAICDMVAQIETQWFWLQAQNEVLASQTNKMCEFLACAHGYATMSIL